MDSIARTKLRKRTQKSPQNPEIPQNGHSPLVYICDSNGTESSRGWEMRSPPSPFSDGILASRPHAGSNRHLSLLRHRGAKDEMFCRLLGSYFNSRRNYSKWQLCARRDSGTDVSKLLSEGEAAERRGLSSVAPRDHPEIRGSFAPFVAGERGGQSSPSGLSLAPLTFAPGPRFPLGNCPRDGGISFCSFCSVLPMKSQWYHKKKNLFMNLGLFYSCLKICNVKSFLSPLVAMFLCMRGRVAGAGAAPPAHHPYRNPNERGKNIPPASNNQAWQKRECTVNMGR